MIPPVFQILSVDPTAIMYLGGDSGQPMRVFPFGEAPEKTLLPYVTYTIFSGIPQNTIDKTPQIDNLGTQIDIWAKTANSALDVAAAVRDALEPYAHMVGLGSTLRDPDTKNYRVRLDFDFFTERN